MSTHKRKRNNAAPSGLPPHMWPARVWERIGECLTRNINSKGTTYTSTDTSADPPPCLKGMIGDSWKPCKYPTCSTAITYVYRPGWWCLC